MYSSQLFKNDKIKLCEELGRVQMFQGKSPVCITYLAKAQDMEVRFGKALSFGIGLKYTGLYYIIQRNISDESVLFKKNNKLDTCV